MTECLVLEMLYNTKLVIVSVIYRSPSQSSQEFQQFEMLFSQLLNDITSKNFHQITFAHITLLIEYPPPYHRLIWDYSNADILNIRKSISSINWSHIDIQVSVFEKCVLKSLKILFPISMFFLTIKNVPGWNNQ